MNKYNLKTVITDVLVIAFGSVLFAGAYNIFLDPNGIAPGGVTGIAMIIHFFLPILPVGVMIIIINLPLFLLGWRSEGRTFLIKSIFGTFLSSVFIDMFSGMYSYTDDPLLSAIYGGILMGAGLGIILTRGATTGGTDIAGRLLINKFPYMSFGRLIFIVDMVIISIAALSFRHVSYALYAVITLYVSSAVIDGILYGLNTAKVAIIISNIPDKIVCEIDAKLSRGATYLNGEGVYSGEERKVILCAIKPRQIAELKEIVKLVDPQSFLIITEAKEVLGDGFRNHGKGIF